MPAIRSCKRNRRNPLVPSRPLNAFMLFKRSVQDKIWQEYDNVHSSSEIAQIAGKLWRELSDDEKAPFISESHALLAEWKENEAKAGRMNLTRSKVVKKATCVAAQEPTLFDQSILEYYFQSLPVPTTFQSDELLFPFTFASTNAAASNAASNPLDMFLYTSSCSSETSDTSSMITQVGSLVSNEVCIQDDLLSLDAFEKEYEIKAFLDKFNNGNNLVNAF